MKCVSPHRRPRCYYAGASGQCRNNASHRCSRTFGRGGLHLTNDAAPIPQRPPTSSAYAIIGRCRTVNPAEGEGLRASDCPDHEVRRSAGTQHISTAVSLPRRSAAAAPPPRSCDAATEVEAVPARAISHGSCVAGEDERRGGGRWRRSLGSVSEAPAAPVTPHPKFRARARASSRRGTTKSRLLAASAHNALQPAAAHDGPTMSGGWSCTQGAGLPLLPPRHGQCRHGRCKNRHRILRRRPISNSSFRSPTLSTALRKQEGALPPLLSSLSERPRAAADVGSEHGTAADEPASFFYVVSHSTPPPCCLVLALPHPPSPELKPRKTVSREAGGRHRLLPRDFGSRYVGTDMDAIILNAAAAAAAEDAAAPAGETPCPLFPFGPTFLGSYTMTHSG